MNFIAQPSSGIFKDFLKRFNDRFTFYAMGCALISAYGFYFAKNVGKPR
jgi:hypothetical protein